MRVLHSMMSGYSLLIFLHVDLDTINLIQFLQEVPEYHEHLEKIEVYKNNYGVLN